MIIPPSIQNMLFFSLNKIKLAFAILLPFFHHFNFLSKVAINFFFFSLLYFASDRFFEAMNCTCYHRTAASQARFKPKFKKIK